MKFLFNDGSGSTREVYSEEELNILINNVQQKEKIRIWKFNTSQWITYADYIRERPARPERFKVPVPDETIALDTGHTPQRSAPGKFKKFLTTLKIVIISASILGVITLLAFVLLKKEWLDAAPGLVFAERPVNSPPLNTDSLVTIIQQTEFRTLDKLTKTNLRLRNNWPDKIVLSLQYEKRQHANDATLFRFENSAISIENTTGYELDNAVVELKVWKLHQNIRTDTFHFAAVSYVGPSVKYTVKQYEGDSLSVNFQKIRSYGLNFCYSYGLPSVSGNPNDKWFCKD
jgi:hypothetical protein